MLGNLMCWAMAIGIMISKPMGLHDLYIRTLLAMGFVFLGILNKAVDTYRDTHVIEIDEETLNQIKKNT